VNLSRRPGKTKLSGELDKENSGSGEQRGTHYGKEAWGLKAMGRDNYTSTKYEICLFYRKRQLKSQEYMFRGRGQNKKSETVAKGEVKN